MSKRLFLKAHIRMFYLDSHNYRFANCNIIIFIKKWVKK